MTPMTWKISQPILDDFVHRTSTHTSTVDLKILVGFLNKS